MTVIAGAVLIGATAGMASAASYPEPFTGNTAVVAGVNANFADTLAAGEIVSNLNAVAVGTGGGDTTIVGGEFVKLDKSSNHLNLRDALNGPFGSTVDYDDFPELLADGEYTAEDSDDFSYEQKITLGAQVLSHFRDSDYEDQEGLDDKTPTLGINISDGGFIMNYTLDFLDQAASTITSGDLDDFEGSSLPLLGKEFYVSDAKNVTWVLTLLDSATESVISEGDTVTMSLNGVQYQVTLDVVADTETIFTINGETTRTLNEGETFKLSNDVYLAVRDIIYVSKETGISRVSFSLGSGKLEITSGNDVKINDESISDLKAWITEGTHTATESKLDKIEIEWRANDDMFITPNSEIELPGFGGIKLSMTDIIRNEEEMATLANDGDDSVVLEAPVKDGKAELNLLYANATGEFTGIGKSATERLLTVAPTASDARFWKKFSAAEFHEKMVISYNSSTDAESYVLSFTTNEDTSSGRNETTVKNEVTGETWSDRKAGDVFNLGDVQFTISHIWDNSTDEGVEINWTIGDGMSIDRLYTKGGLMIQLPYNTSSAGSQTAQGAVNLTGDNVSAGAGHNWDSFYVFMKGEDKDDNKVSGTLFNFTVNDNSDSELEVSELDNAGTGGKRGLEIGDGNTYETYIKDDVAPRIIHSTGSDQDSVEVYYPTGESETYAEVFLASTGATITSGGSNGVMTYFDNEASKFAGMNLVVVGGSAINAIAEELLGGAYAGEAFTAVTGVDAGGYLIESFDRSGMTALLVAGYNAADTTKATTYLLNNDVDTTVGTKYTGVTATEATLVTA